MKKRTREKIALLVFALLVIVGGSVLLRYFDTGRSFNVAASVVDDAFGQMTGYSVIVYDGTASPATQTQTSKDAASSNDASVGTSAGAVETAKDADTSTDAAEITSGTGTSSSAANTNDESFIDALTSFGSNIASTISKELSRLPDALLDRTVYTSDVRALYEEKGAGVITLNDTDLSYYETPTILYADSRKIGVVSLDYYASAEKIKKLQQEMSDAGAQTLVCIVPRQSFLATTEGFQIVLVTNDSEATPGSSKIVGSTTIAYAPEKGQVGALLVTSVNVVTSKVYSSL